MKRSIQQLRKCVDEVCRDLNPLMYGKTTQAVEKLINAGDAGVQAVLAGPTSIPDGVHPRDVWDGLATIMWLVAKRNPEPILNELQRAPTRNCMLISALSAAKCRASEKALLDAMTDRDQNVRWSAVEALIHRKVKAAKPAFIRAILDRSSLVQFAVVDAINKMDIFRDVAALPNLKRLLAWKTLKKHSPGTWQRASEAVARLEKEAQSHPVLEAHYSWSAVTNRDLLRIVNELPELEVLDISETRIGDTGVQHLRKLRRLRKLDLQNTKVTWRGIADVATHLPQLKSLSIGGAALKGTHLKTLSPLIQLEELDLGGVWTTDAELVHITPLRKLKALEIFFWCGNDGLRSIAKLKKLETLVLYDTQVTDAGLSFLKSLGRLTSLRLSFTRGITDASVVTLGLMNQLRDLRINGTGISPKGTTRLKALLPNCEVAG